MRKLLAILTLAALALAATPRAEAFGRARTVVNVAAPANVQVIQQGRQGFFGGGLFARRQAAATVNITAGGYVQPQAAFFGGYQQQAGFAVVRERAFFSGGYAQQAVAAVAPPCYAPPQQIVAAAAPAYCQPQQIVAAAAPAYCPPQQIVAAAPAYAPPQQIVYYAPPQQIVAAAPAYCAPQQIVAAAAPAYCPPAAAHISYEAAAAPACAAGVYGGFHFRGGCH